MVVPSYQGLCAPSFTASHWRLYRNDLRHLLPIAKQKTAAIRTIVVFNYLLTGRSVGSVCKLLKTLIVCRSFRFTKIRVKYFCKTELGVNTLVKPPLTSKVVPVNNYRSTSPPQLTSMHLFPF